MPRTIPIGRKVEKAYKRLVSDLAAGKYPLNTALPPGRELSVKYDVCHRTLRMAIRHLAEEGRLEPRHGSGVYVLPPGPQSGTSSSVVCFMTTMDNGFFTDVQNSAINRSLILNPYIQNRNEWNSSNEKKFLEFVRNSRPLALLAFCSPLKPTNDKLLREIAANGTYVIHIEPFRYETLPEQNYLMPDYRRAGYMAATKLMRKGCKKIYQLGFWTRPNPMELLVEKGINEVIEEHSGEVAQSLRMEMLLDVDDKMDEFCEYVAEIEEGAGLISFSYTYVLYVNEMARQIGRNDLGMIGIQAPYENVDGSSFDCLKLDRCGIIERILDSRFNGEIKELVPPKWKSGMGREKD